ncbi:MAG: hypothetical protein WCV85_02490 [Patescibacteria group bacterium]|jgi:hypothetical protein
MRRFWGVTIIAVLAVVGTLALIGWSIRTTALQSTPWKAALRDGRVYDRLITETFSSLVRDPGAFGEVFQDTPLSADDLTVLAREVLTADYLQTQTENGLDVLFALPYSRTGLADVTWIIPLQDIKRRLPTAVADVIEKKLAKLPVCTEKQLDAFEQEKTLTDGFPSCLPKGVSAKSIVTQAGIVEDIASSIPETFDVAADLRSRAFKKVQCSSTAPEDPNQGCVPEEVTFNVQTQVQGIQDALRYLQTLHWTLTILALALLTGIFTIFLPHLRRSTWWLGLAMVIPSLVVLGIASLGSALLVSVRPAGDDPAEKFVQSLVVPVVQSIGTLAAERALVFGGIGVAVGIACCILAFAFPKPPPRKNP